MAALALLTACGGSPGTPRDPLAAAGKEPPKPGAPADLPPAQGQQQENRPIHLAIQAEEVTEDGTVLSLPGDGVAEVDVNSVIRLKMNRAMINARIASHAGANARRLQQLESQVQLATRAIQLQKEALAAIEPIRAATPKTTEYDQAVRNRGTLARQALKATEELLAARGRDVEAFLLEGPQRAPEILEAEAQGIASDLAALVDQTSSVRWRVQAQLTTGGKSTPIHVPGYDTLTEGTPRLIDKLAPVMTDEVKKQYELAQQLADAAADLQSNARRALDGLVADIEKAARDLQSSGDLLDRLGAIEIKLKGSENARVKALGAAVAAEGRYLGSIARACKAAGPQLAAARRAGDALLVAQAAIDLARQCAAPLLADERRKGLGEIAARLKATLSDQTTKASLTADVLGDLEALRPIETLLATLEGARSVIDELTKTTAQVAGFQSFAVRAPLADRGYGQIDDTVVDLTRTERKERDYVSFRPAITRSGEVVVEGTPVTMRVVRTGALVNLSAALIFVSPVGGRGDNESLFRPAPAVTTALHYRASRAAGQAEPSGGAAVWNFLNLGIGIHAATLVMGRAPEGESKIAEGATGPEIGLGGTLQLFGDVAQVGVGYDLQAERPYWFLGLGLQTATNFGLSFPSAGGQNSSSQP